ncbi:MAG: fibronectin type III domain-containing protein [Dictyoglomaceae bacterium]
MKKNILIILLLIFSLLISGCAPPVPPTPQNNPPNAPSNPNPPDGGTGVIINPELSWECYDPDGDTLVFDIYLGTNQANLPKIKDNHTTKSYTVSNLSYNTTYYWKIVAEDGKGGVKEGPVWRFTTQQQGQVNNPPSQPSNPNPPDNAQNVPASTPILSWQCSDSDNDPLVYDIYFGTDENNLLNIKANHPTTSYQLYNLSLNTTYYWRVVAKDSKGAKTEGPIWSFKTTQSSDIEKAKALIADLRNTILTIHDYKGIGVPGIVDTPFQRLSQEIQEKIVPDLTETINRIGFILYCGYQIYGQEGTYTFTYTDQNYTLYITHKPATGANTQLKYDFNGYKGGSKIDYGTFIVNYDSQNAPTSGSLNATMKTKDGNLVINGGYTATKLPHAEFFNEIEIKGNITSPYVTIDFSKDERKLYAKFGEWWDQPNGRWLVYLDELRIIGQITTTTAQADGDLYVDAIHVEYPGGNTSNPPKDVSFTGKFREMKDGAPTGAYFEGTILAKYLNPSQYNPNYPESSDNFPKWEASFNGHIEAPKRPKIDANLSVSHTEYKKYKIQVGYERTNPDGSKVWLKTPLTPPSEYNEWDQVLNVVLNNQDNLKVLFTVDWKISGDGKFSGQITNSSGTKLADLYLENGIPMVKYSDGYIESIF